LPDDDSVKALQDALGTTTKNKTTLRNQGYQQLAQRLAVPESTSGNDDLLVVLQRAGFLGFDAVGNSTVNQFPGRGAGITLVVGNQGAIDPDLVALPLGTELHSAEVPTVVAGVWHDVADAPARADAVQPIRDDDLAKTVSTVDDLDLVEGPTTVVLAMSDLFLTPPVVGHYGYGSNTRPLPDSVNS